MKFLLIDKIESLVPGERIVAIKNLSLAEEYLQDHFPSFPVLPGVLMLEALTQSAAWLVRLHDDWAYSLVVLKAARNLKYASFLRPGNTLRCEVDVMKLDDTKATFKAAGYVGETLAVSARIELSRTRLSDTKGARGERIDSRLIADLKEEFELVGGPDLLESQS